MSIKDWWAKYKPSFIGFGIGLVVAPILMFSSGWVVSSSDVSKAANEATIEAWSTVCINRSTERANETNRPLSDLSGWDNREARQTFVNAIVADMGIPETIRASVTNGCSRSLGYAG